ncbi:glycosyltransferase family 2 protein [Acetobacterium carbinolicum]|uniref:glycosyltransferase family 2 protein n=1 Tax=Acetobacterium TaxID=33951 RepID=UPI0013A6EFF8|nr:MULTISPECIES: glycosyltransferase family 2 protein [unclassified Acetobacterium]MDZ5725860.1 glycosyltransferase family 2 protein [Acetobacterium sp. K1/6]
MDKAVKLDQDVSIVIPVYNSAQSIRELIRRLVTTLEARESTFEIILVDDCSKDDSREVIRVLEAVDSRIVLIALDQNSGQQSAIKTGLAQSRGRKVITIDDDLQQQPEDIMLLLDEIKKGFDVVYGIPDRAGYPFYRQLGSNLVDLFFTLILKKPKRIRVGSFRVLNRETVEQIIKDQTPFVYITAITLRFTKNIGNVKVAFKQRRYGKSNYTIKKLSQLLLRLFYYYGCLNSDYQRRK